MTTKDIAVVTHTPNNKAASNFLITRRLCAKPIKSKYKVGHNRYTVPTRRAPGAPLHSPNVIPNAPTTIVMTHRRKASNLMRHLVNATMSATDVITINITPRTS